MNWSKWLALAVLLVMAVPNVSAFCSDAYTMRRSITTTNNNANPFYVNDSYGMDFGGGPQYIACNATSNYLCYTNTASYACYKDETKMPTFINQGNGTQYLNPENGLVLWLHLNGTDGYDSGLYHNAGTKYGTPLVQPGKVGKGLNFGATSNISYGDLDSLDGLTNLTVCVWANQTAAKVTSALVGKYNNVGMDGWMLSYENNHLSIQGYTTGGYAQAVTATTDNTLNEWHHVCGSYDGDFHLYRDGVSVINNTGGSGAITAGTDSMIVGSSYATLEFPGVEDEVMVWNRTLSTVEIKAIMNNTHPDGYAVIGAIEYAPPYALSLFNPTNTTYVGTTSASVLYSFSNSSACTYSGYSLDGAANVTMECINSTFTFASGSHSLRVWVLDNLGYKYTSIVYFTSSYAVYTINVTDEMTYTLYNGTNASTTTNKLYVFCADKTEITTLTSNPMNVSISCAFEEIKMEIVDKNNGTQWRTRYPTVYNGTLEFVMVNETAYDAIEQTWQMYDVTGDYSGGFLKVTKAILTYGIKTIEEKLIDASGNAVLYLIPGERYCFSVLNSGMTSERNLGCLYATTETSTRTEISRVPYAPDIDLTYKDVLVYFAWNKDSQYIQGIYNDTTSTTTSVNFTVYNASAPTQVMFTSVSTFNYVVFTYNAVNTNGTYVAVITAINSKYGTLTEKKVIGFYATGQEKPSLPTGYGWLLSAAGGLISIFMMLAFGRKRQNIGIGVSVMFMLLFMYWGWFDSTPMLGWGFLTLITFIAVIGFFIRRDNA